MGERVAVAVVVAVVAVVFPLRYILCIVQRLTVFFLIYVYCRESEKQELLQNNKKYLNEMTIKIHDAANASLQKERNDISKVVAAKVAEGLKEAYAKSNRAIQQTEMERRNHATEYLRRNQGIKKRELMIDTRLMGLKDRHTKEMSGMKARYARMFKEMQEKMEQNTMKNQHLVEELSTENVWLRQRVADLQEMVVAFQDAMTLN